MRSCSVPEQRVWKSEWMQPRGHVSKSAGGGGAGVRVEGEIPEEQREKERFQTHPDHQ